MNDILRFELDGPVGTITFNRPRALNAINLDMSRAMVRLAGEIDGVKGMKVVVMRGAGSHFMAGGDIRIFKDTPENRLRTLDELIDGFHVFIRMLRRIPQPVVSAVSGAAAGGGFSLALAADIIVADATAKFTPAYRMLGTTPDGGGTFFLPRLVGQRMAARLLLAGDTLGAEEAHAIGLVQVLDRSGTGAELERVVASLSRNSAPAAASTKSLLSGGELEALDVHLDAEKRSFLNCAGGADFVEGVDAFLEKRPPRFAS
ncbi:MAG: enoyl-CoA hydratase/isomerase family protein [Rhizobiaceae bacterium]